MDLSSTTVRSTFIKTLMVSASRLRSGPMATCPGTCIYSHLLQALAVLPPPKSVCPWIVLRYVSYLLRRWVYPYATLLASAAACLAAPLLIACCSAACALAAGSPCALIACPPYAP